MVSEKEARAIHSDVLKRIERRTSFEDFSDSGEYFDLKNETSIIELKTTVMRRSNGNRGRFRVGKVHHDKLKNDERNGYYLFIVYVETKNNDLKIQLAKLIKPDQFRGLFRKWNDASSAANPYSKQEKITWTGVFTGMNASDVETRFYANAQNAELKSKTIRNNYETVQNQMHWWWNE